jgi:hypothetical protein
MQWDERYTAYICRYFALVRVFWCRRITKRNVHGVNVYVLQQSRYNAMKGAIWDKSWQKCVIQQSHKDMWRFVKYTINQHLDVGICSKFLLPLNKCSDNKLGYTFHMLHTQYENVRCTDPKHIKDSPHTIILYMLMHVRCMIFIQTLPQNNRTNPCPNMNCNNEKQSKNK